MRGEPKSMSLPSDPPCTESSPASLGAQGVLRVEEGVLRLAQDLPLRHGGVLSGVEVAWRLEGPPDAPVVVALGGISAHRRIFGTSDPRAGWWSELAGPGRPLDAARFRLLGFDFLGGSGLTTGPAPGAATFPAISAHDQARLLVALADHLGIATLHAIAGASYGGMVALAFAAQYPDRVARLLVIGAAHRSNPMATAWRSVQREIVRFGLARGDGPGGLRLARALAMATYRTRAEFATRFTNEARLVDGRATFPVEDYLFARGDAYAGQYRPEAFLCLSQSIDLQQVDPAAIHVPTVLVGVREDQLVTIEDMRELAERLAGPCQLHEIHSLIGHDAFLKERDLLAPAFAQALDGDLS
jgi:homoserine O-acetyltransferase/O-succinyltransferase